jgi:hypothetical protein
LAFSDAIILLPDYRLRETICLKNSASNILCSINYFAYYLID